MENHSQKGWFFESSQGAGPTLRGVSGGVLPPRGYGEAPKRCLGVDAWYHPPFGWDINIIIIIIIPIPFKFTPICSWKIVKLLLLAWKGKEIDLVFATDRFFSIFQWLICWWLEGHRAWDCTAQPKWQYDDVGDENIMSNTEYYAWIWQAMVWIYLQDFMNILR